MYKPSRTHVVVDALSRLPNTTKPIGMPNQTQIQVCFTQNLNG
jgi:hypothetical protein